MRTQNDMRQFDHILSAWREAADFARAAREAYRVAHAQASLASLQKTEAAKKAEADVCTSALRSARDKAEITERECYHAMIFARGSAGEAEREAA